VKLIVLALMFVMVTGVIVGVAGLIRHGLDCQSISIW
jgi:hypothetical protein